MPVLSHFLKNLYNHTLDEDGFSLRRSRNFISLTSGENRYALLSGFGLSKQRQKNIRGFKLRRQIDVAFDKTFTYRFINQPYTLSIERKSGVKANTQDDTFFIDNYGLLLEPTSLVVFGHWSYNRVASSLPLNYSLRN